MACKFLCDPVYTLKDTRRCIAHYSVDECARHVLNKYPDSFVYYIRPSAPGDEHFIFDEDLAADFPGRVKYWDGFHIPHNRVFQFIWRHEWFSDLIAGTGYAWDWDVLLTMRGPVMQHVKWLNWGGTQQAKKILIQDHFPILDFKVAAKFYFRGDKMTQLTTLGSYACADKVVVGADYEAKSIMRTARQYLSASVCKRLQNKLESGFVVPRGLDLEYPFKKEPPKTGRPIVGIFTQRIGLAGRHPFAALDAFFYSFVKRDAERIKFHISTNSMVAFSDDDLNKYSFVEFYQSDRAQFYEKLRQSDFCISFSTTEGMPTSILEAICWGCIPVLVRYDWSEDMVGKDYPLLFKSQTEAVAMVGKILDNPVEMFRRYQEWYRSYFLPYLDRCGSLLRACDEMVERNAVEVDEFASKRQDNPLYAEIQTYVERKKISRIVLYDLLKRLKEDGVVRVDPDTMGVGKRPQKAMGRAVPARLPNYYTILHTLLKKTGWRRGIEVGEIITDL